MRMVPSGLPTEEVLKEFGSHGFVFAELRRRV